MEDVIFVVLQEHINVFNIEKEIRKYYSDAIIQVIPEVLNGAVFTCCEGLKVIDDNLPVLFNDCDHAFMCEPFYEYCRKANFADIDGALLTFASNCPDYSYVKFNEHGAVDGTIEKVVASNEAICGAYYFRNKQIFLDGVDTYLRNCAYKEFFVSGVYNALVEQGRRLATFLVSDHISFGTPLEYELAMNDDRLGILVE